MRFGWIRTARRTSSIMTGLVVSALLGAANLSCGSKSALRVPCEIPLEPSLADVVLVTDHSDTMADRALDGSIPWEVVVSEMHRVLPRYDADIALGVLSFPRTGCETFDALNVAIGANHSTRVLTFIDTLGVPNERGNGTPTFDALRTAHETLLRTHRTGLEQFILLVTDGGPSCNSSFTPENCDCLGAPLSECISPLGGNSCSDHVRVIQELQALAVDEISTIVVGIDISATALTPAYRRILDLMADAGGRPRMTGAGHHYYAATNASELEAAFVDVIAPIARCRLHAIRDPGARDVVLRGESGFAATRDATRTDGWDWLDRERLEIGVFGTACSEMARGSLRVWLTTMDYRCVAE
jgi:hypothetical protein